MPTKKPIIQSVVRNSTYKKVQYLAAQEERSTSNMGAYIIEQYIEQYEKEHGTIPIDPPAEQ